MENEYLEKALDLFLFGLGTLIIAIILNNPLRKKKVKQNLSFGLEHKDKLEYINDGFRIINTGRLKSIYLFAAVFIIASIIYLILGIIEYF
ncbi:hypothetical protein ACTS9D_12355 [Empedobacter brevis]